MEINFQERDNSIFLEVRGDIEMMSIRIFKEKLFNIGQSYDKDIDMDLANVDYIDSSGVGILLSLLKMQRSKGRELKIVKVSTRVLTVLKLSSLTDVFNL